MTTPEYDNECGLLYEQNALLEWRARGKDGTYKIVVEGYTNTDLSLDAFPRYPKRVTKVGDYYTVFVYINNTYLPEYFLQMHIRTGQLRIVAVYRSQMLTVRTAKHDIAENFASIKLTPAYRVAVEFLKESGEDVYKMQQEIDTMWRSAQTSVATTMASENAERRELQLKQESVTRKNTPTHKYTIVFRNYNLDEKVVTHDNEVGTIRKVYPANYPQPEYYDVTIDGKDYRDSRFLSREEISGLYLKQH